MCLQIPFTCKHTEPADWVATSIFHRSHPLVLETRRNQAPATHFWHRHASTYYPHGRQTSVLGAPEALAWQGGSEVLWPHHPHSLQSMHHCTAGFWPRPGCASACMLALGVYGHMKESKVKCRYLRSSVVYCPLMKRTIAAQLYGARTETSKRYGRAHP